MVSPMLVIVEMAFWAHAALLSLKYAIPSNHLIAGHHWPASETPFEWRFAGGPIVARHCLLAEYELKV